MSLSAMDVAKLFEKDVATRKRPAELLVAEPDVRPAIINAVLKDVTTKTMSRDLEKSLIEKLRK